MHRKILVIDEENVFLGSANFTFSSLKLHDNFLVGLHHPSLGYHLTHDSNSPFKFSLGECWLLPDRSGEALDRLIKLIDEAKKSIKVAMFTLTHPRLIEALISAHQRGIKVEIAVDYFTGQGASMSSLKQLQASGIPSFLSSGAQLFHHKWVLIDGTHLITGSANWTQVAFEKNEDDFLILNLLTKDQKKYIKKMWKCIRNETEDFSHFIEEIDPL
jgi:phosphatidylserine/phosphatidylglycerophosphate/cardiolipin synthase-like enzyme